MLEKFKNVKNIKIYIILLIVAAILVIVGLTYAFFAPGGLFGDASKVTVSTEDIGHLTFTKGADISLVASTANFSQGAGNVTGEATSMARYTGPEGTSEKYNVYFRIINNEYTYTQNENTPEIILTITDPDGNPVTEITGYDYVTNGGVSGFDITNRSGLIVIKEDYNINGNATNDETHEWNVKITYINLDAGQTPNEGKTLNASLILQKDKLEFAGNQIASLAKTSSDIYYHDENLVNGANDNSYRYTGADPNNYVCFGSDEEVCPDINMHRILGVFDNKLKLIASRGYTEDDNSSAIIPLSNNNYDYRSDVKRIGNIIDPNEHCLYPTNPLNPMTPSSIKADGNEWEVEEISNSFIDSYLINSYKKYNNMISKEVVNIGEISADLSSANFQILEDAKSIYDLERSGITTSGYAFSYMSYSEYMYAVDKSYWGLNALNNANSQEDYYKNGELENNNWLYFKNDLHNTFVQLTNNFFRDPLTDDTDYLEIILSDNLDMFDFSNITPEIIEQLKEIMYPTFYLRESVTLSSGDGTINNPYRLYDLEAIDYDPDYPDILETCEYISNGGVDY